MDPQVGQAISTDSNFSRYYAMVNILNSNTELRQLMYKDMELHGSGSEWVLNRVIY